MSTETKVLIGIITATIVLVVGAALLFGGKSSESQNTEPISNPEVLIRNDSHIVKATEKNAVTIVEFGDFQCPACGSAFPIVEQIKEEYKGKITFVFRNFPLAMHANAKPAAQAAEAAGAQGKYFEMYSLLYENQEEWGETNDAMQFFMGYAKELKLDMEKFETEVKENKYEKKIQQDLNDGTAAGVNATPTFFINGVLQRGGLSYNDFKTKIDEALKKSGE